PDDPACLRFLMAQLYPSGIYCPTCEKVTKHHKDKLRPSWQCQFCGHREHPMVGTIFENSATSLKLWFDAIYLMASTRCGISATVIPPGDTTLKRHVRRRVLPASVVFTDEAGHYWGLRSDYTHGRVNHQAGVYVSGDVHTNTIEGFWSLVKRGISGTYHNVS